MKRAAIDIGTNSVRLLTCQLTDGQLSDRQKIINMTRIGKGVDQTGVIETTRLDATVAVLQSYSRLLEQLGIDQCPVFATSALRDAENSRQFLDAVAQNTPFRVQIISGTEEATYGYLGVVKGAARGNGRIVVVDVGGGSTEIIVGDRAGRIAYSHSFDIGAVRLTDRFALGHQLSADDVAPIRRLTAELLTASPLMRHIEGPLTCVGIGGTATTLAAIDLALSRYDGDVIHNYAMSHRQLSDIVERLTMSSRDEKLGTVGLNPKRVDIIAAGTVIVDSVLSALNQDEMTFSDYDNLEGAIFYHDDTTC